MRLNSIVLYLITIERLSYVHEIEENAKGVLNRESADPRYNHAFRGIDHFIGGYDCLYLYLYSDLLSPCILVGILQT